MRGRLVAAIAIAVACGAGVSGAASAGVFSTSPPARNSAPLQSATLTPALTPGTPTVEYDCSGPTGTRLEVEPASIVIACADGGIGAQGLSWQSWGTSEAHGRGVVWWHVCTPDCAASSTYDHYPAEITLSRPVETPKGPVFSAMSVRYTGTGPRRSPTGSLVRRFELEYPPG